MKASKKSKIKGAQFYKVGHKVETIKENIGAWFTADIIDILPNSKCECLDECHCTYKLLLEGSKNDNDEIVERKLSEIREVSYLSIDWDKLEVGMRVVINYNIDKPKKWGYWYDYIIEDLQKRNDVYFLKGTLLVGLDGSSRKLTVSIDSENVSDVLEIRPHIPLQEKEMGGYETGVRPECCVKCKNKPKVRCKVCCCCQCGVKKDFDLTVQCDECAAWYHIYCMKPPMTELPNDDWYCPKCNNETRRGLLESKQQRKKRKYVRRIKVNDMNPKCNLKKTLKIAEKPSQPIETPIKFENYDFEQDVEMRSETKQLPKNSVIWKQIQELFPEYDLLQVSVKVIRKQTFQRSLSFAAEEFINKDTVNEHLWKEAKENLVKGKQAFLDAVKRIFTCAICCELLNDPITLSCKHSFCIDCFFKSLSVNVYNCALCRVHVIHTQHYVVNDNLKRALALLFKENAD